MADTLKDIYAKAGLADRYFDGATPPIDLWRAQTAEDFENKVFVLEPHPGNERRRADVKIVDRDGKKIVLGCIATAGDDHTGVSTFDAPVQLTKRHTVQYRIPGGTPLTENLAVTKDDYNRRWKATHYTIAPKNDMPLELFMASLKAVAAKAVREG